MGPDGQVRERVTLHALEWVRATARKGRVAPALRALLRLGSLNAVLAEAVVEALPHLSATVRRPSTSGLGVGWGG